MQRNQKQFNESLEILKEIDELMRQSDDNPDQKTVDQVQKLDKQFRLSIKKVHSYNQKNRLNQFYKKLSIDEWLSVKQKFVLFQNKQKKLQNNHVKHVEEEKRDHHNHNQYFQNNNQLFSNNNNDYNQQQQQKQIGNQIQGSVAIDQIMVEKDGKQSSVYQLISRLDDEEQKQKINLQMMQALQEIGELKRMQAEIVAQDSEKLELIEADLEEAEHKVEQTIEELKGAALSNNERKSVKSSLGGTAVTFLGATIAFGVGIGVVIAAVFYKSFGWMKKKVLGKNNDRIKSINANKNKKSKKQVKEVKEKFLNKYNQREKEITIEEDSLYNTYLDNQPIKQHKTKHKTDPVKRHKTVQHNQDQEVYNQQDQQVQVKSQRKLSKSKTVPLKQEKKKKQKWYEKLRSKF